MPERISNFWLRGIGSALGKRSRLLVLAVLFAAGCATSEIPFQRISDTDRYIQIDATLGEDPEMAALIAPYRTDLQSRMNRVIAWSETPLERGRPEGPLNNLSADIVRFRAVRELGKPVHIGVVNFGGLRVPLPQGNITVGNIYELMPFENHITVLLLDGNQVQVMADQIAVRGGEPVSGIRFRIENGRATDILVGHQPLDPAQNYLVATNSFMADGGDGVTVFMDARERIDLPVLIRDAMIEYIRMLRHVHYENEQRIRFTQTEEE